MTPEQFIDKWFPLPKLYDKDKNSKLWNRDEAMRDLDNLINQKRRRRNDNDMP